MQMMIMSKINLTETISKFYMYARQSVMLPQKERRILQNTSELASIFTMLTFPSILFQEGSHNSQLIAQTYLKRLLMENVLPMSLKWLLYSHLIHFLKKELLNKAKGLPLRNSQSLQEAVSLLILFHHHQHLQRNMNTVPKKRQTQE